MSSGHHGSRGWKGKGPGAGAGGTGARGAGSGASRGASAGKAAGKGDDAASGAAPRRPAAAPLPRKGWGGFRHAVAAGDKPLKTALQRRGFAESRVLTQWEEVAGAALAPLCRPVKVDYAAGGFGATLVVMADGARAPEVTMLRPRIIERVNAFYGYRAISRVRVVQTAPGAGALSLSSRNSDAGAAARRLAAAISSEEVRAVETLSGRVEDEGLRDALSRLGCNVMRRRRAADEKD